MQILLALVFMVAGADGPSECANPPSRVLDSYWDYIEACGCSKLEAPSRASSAHGRYMKACSAWRERNPAARFSSPEPEPSPSPSPAARECTNPPSRIASDYWDHLESCGCAGVEAPPRASDDFQRFRKTCSDWREDNPVIVRPTPRPSPAKDAPRPSGH